MQQETTTTNTYPLSLAGTETGLAGRKPSVVQMSLNEHGEQLDKLGELLGILRERLQPVSLSVPQENGNAAVQNGQAPASMVAVQVRSQTERVYAMQARVNTILEELET